MRVLFLDDNHTRFKSFRSNMIGTIVDRASTAVEAIDLLSRVEYSVVFLDYDLDETGGRDGGIGTDVSSYVAKRADLFGRTLFVMHTLNKEGRDAMRADLMLAGLDQFAFPWAWDHVSPELVRSWIENPYSTGDQLPHKENISD